jgi:anti-sigma regulatory factor (Ser/Thr protein kinase)
MPAQRTDDDAAPRAATPTNSNRVAAASGPWRLAAGPTASTKARRLARNALRAANVAASDIDTVELVISELVTNVLQHAFPVGDATPARDVDDAPIQLSVRLLGSDVVVGVFDPSPLMPRLIATSTSDECGRGLRLVAALTSEWGAAPVVVDGRRIGKTVSARVPVRVASSPDEGGRHLASTTQGRARETLNGGESHT